MAKYDQCAKIVAVARFSMLSGRSFTRGKTFKNVFPRVKMLNLGKLKTFCRKLNAVAVNLVPRPFPWLWGGAGKSREKALGRRLCGC